MRIGHFIKEERIKQQMKQIYLAQDICSASYLSKIENNEISPSKEILDLLLEKLSITIDSLNLTPPDIEDNNIKFELLEVYREVTINRDIEFAKEKIKYYYDNRFLFFNEEVIHTYNLTMIRLILSDKDNLQLLDLYLKPIQSDYHLLTSNELYLLRKFEGIHFFHLNNYKEALIKFEEALSIGYDKPEMSWEMADFYYMYSLANLSDNQYINALKFSEKSLKYFIENLQFRRAIECYTVQAISYKMSNKYDEAINIYLKSILIIEKIDLKEYKPLIFHNLGSLYSSLGDFTKAIEYYLKSLELKTKEHLITIFSLIQVYSKINNKKEIIKWINLGLDMTENDSYSVKYKYHFLFYKEIHSDENQKENVDLMSSIISFFEFKNDYRHAYKYCIKLGDVLINRNMYKKASIFYKKAIDFKNKHLNHTYWEDI
ncbi:tetratricopeptide repeat protein [Psychrobacillus sp. L4]|uniref:tetratricopeptide repeat protein n=1 Tax=Psychrobacillus sp. L4 TaxID=3236892 RepID=UPI0036F1DA52